MNSLLRVQDEQGHWNLEDIEFAIEERIGEPQDFIGRVQEMEYLYQWAGNIQRGISRSIAFLGRRKIGKSLMLERLYNILYSEQKGLIPFYYEFGEGRRSGKEFFHDFTLRFYLQAIGYYTRDISWIRKAIDKLESVDLDLFAQAISALPDSLKHLFEGRLDNCARWLKTDKPPYEYVLAAVDAPFGLVNTPGLDIRVVQMLDEFQYFNMYIDAGVEDKPCKAYMSTAEKRSAPLLITGSLMGVVSEELMRWLPQRFSTVKVPKMKVEETIAMTLNYGRLYGHDLTPEIAEYIAYVTNNVPGRIVELLAPQFSKPRITTLGDVDQALELEVRADGNIKNDWDEYLLLAMDAVNDVNMRRITYFLCQHEGEWFSPQAIKEALSLDIDESRLRKELELLYKYDIIELGKFGRYGGVFDRTLKKVLMVNYADLLDIPAEEFDSYFKNDNMLDYVQELTEQLDLSLAERRDLKQKFDVLQRQHNNLKGDVYEQEVLLDLLKGIMKGEGGLIEGMEITAMQFTLKYHLETGEEIDVVLEGQQAVVMVECKHYAPENLDRLTPKMVDDFTDKARRLHQSRFAGKDLRLGFFSKYGLEPSLEKYLTECGIAVL